MRADSPSDLPPERCRLQQLQHQCSRSHRVLDGKVVVGASFQQHFAGCGEFLICKPDIQNDRIVREKGNSDAEIRPSGRTFDLLRAQLPQGRADILRIFAFQKCRQVPFRIPVKLGAADHAILQAAEINPAPGKRRAVDQIHIIK